MADKRQKDGEWEALASLSLSLCLSVSLLIYASCPLLRSARVCVQQSVPDADAGREKAIQAHAAATVTLTKQSLSNDTFSRFLTQFPFSLSFPLRPLPRYERSSR